MELSSLRAFVQVARDRSFSQAAEALFITQPAVSKRIASLEAELDTPLFDRMGRQVLLTETGRHLLPRAEQILAGVADIQRELANLSGRVSGPLAMGTSHHIGLHRLPPILRRYVDRYPEVDLDIRFMSSEKVSQGVEQGELELGVITLPLQPSDHLQLLPVWRDPLLFVVAEDHPLAELGEVRPEVLIEYPAVLPTRATYTRSLLEEAFLQADGEIRCGLSTDYLETLKMMATIGLGWSLLPESMLSQGLVELHVDGIRLARSLGIVTHRHRTPSNAARAMMQQLVKDAKNRETD
ncbi:MAG: LysR family transcriptional regulator [Gammaproteobacteria bacterium]|nr:LysR family transcriptional regulator [Gammaproteobacteria bacterium]